MGASGPYVVTVKRPSADPEAARLLSAACGGRLLRADSGRWYIDGEARPDRRVRQRLQSRRWLVFPRGWNRLDISLEGEAALALLQPVVSQRAVATLDEAIAKALEVTLPYALVTQPADDEALQRQCLALTESGGSVGPLPDGTLIEVEPVKWDTILDALPADDRERMADTNLTRDAEVLAAYNVREAQHGQ